MRIAIGGISHETTTFIETATKIAEFENGFGLFRGHEMIERFRGTNICSGGFIDAAGDYGFQPIPLLWTFAYPSGLIVRCDYDSLKEEFISRLKDAERDGGVDGVLLDLHGAMVVEWIDDADADLIEAVRAVIGPKRPIVVTFDLHGNHTSRRVKAANAIIGFDTYPHIDMAERGREAAGIIVRTIRREIRPVMAIRQLSLFWGIRCQVTAHPPMIEVMQRVHDIEARPGILAVTLATGFPWADVPEVGASVIVVADSDPDLAQRTADELGDWIWQNRDRWYTPPVTVREALAEGERCGRYPILLADHADNTGGGAPGDSTEILRTLLEIDTGESLLLYLVDPEVARQACDAGIGSRFLARLGGKSHPIQGPPIEAAVDVLAISNGDFAYDGPMYAGLTGNMGVSAWLRTGRVNIVVVTSREQPLDPAFARTLGIDCTKMRVIALKSAAHFRSGFERLAGSIFNVDAAAILSHDFSKLAYRKRTRPTFPIEIPPIATPAL